MRFQNLPKNYISRKENLKKCTIFEEQKRTRYIQRNICFGIIVFSCLSSTKLCLRFSFKLFCSPIYTGRKLNVHKTFRRRPGRLLNALCTFSLRPVSTGREVKDFYQGFLGNEVDFRGMMNVSPNILAKI